MRPGAWDWRANRVLFPNSDLPREASGHPETRMTGSSTPGPFARPSLSQSRPAHLLPWRKTRMGGTAHQTVENPTDRQQGLRRHVPPPAGARGGNGAIPDSLLWESIRYVEDLHVPAFPTLHPSGSQVLLRFGSRFGMEACRTKPGSRVVLSRSHGTAVGGL